MVNEQKKTFGKLQEIDFKEIHSLKIAQNSPCNCNLLVNRYIGLHSNNPLDPPKMVANYLTHPDDVKVLVAGIRVIQRLANTSVMQNQYGMTIDYEEYGDCAKRFGFVTLHFFSSDNLTYHITDIIRTLSGVAQLSTIQDRKTTRLAHVKWDPDLILWLLWIVSLKSMD